MPSARTMSLLECNNLIHVDLAGKIMTIPSIKKQLFSVSVLITLGLSGCSDPIVNSDISSTSGSVSQTGQQEATRESKPADQNRSLVSEITYFDFDSAALSAETKVVLDSAINKFAKNPSARIVISGHADERGTREYNLALGHQRASNVADYIVAKGIDGLRVKKVSYGKEIPMVKGSNETEWSKNRRVEINEE